MKLNTPSLLTTAVLMFGSGAALAQTGGSGEKAGAGREGSTVSGGPTSGIPGGPGSPTSPNTLGSTSSGGAAENSDIARPQTGNTRTNPPETAGDATHNQTIVPPASSGGNTR